MMRSFDEYVLLVSRMLRPSLFKPLGELIFLSISFNKVTRIESQTLSELDSLEWIDLSHNHVFEIQSMAFANLRNLRHIHLQGNDIQKIEDEAFYYLPKLELLDLSFNQIKSLVLSYFDQVGTLSTLTVRLQENQIGVKSNLQASDLGTTTTSATKGQAGDPQAGLPAPQVSSLEFLDLSGNKISSLADLSFLPLLRNSLTQLLLGDNRLSNISTAMSGLKQLQVLVLRRNGIQLIQAEAFLADAGLQVIDLSNNVISDLLPETFRDNSNLRILNVSENQLRAFPETLFAGHRNLQAVYSSKNLLSSFPLTTLVHCSSSLRIIDLSFNQIRSLNLDHAAHTSFPHLLRLDVSHNQIKSLSEQLFAQRFPQLQHLDLSFNAIRVVSDSLFDGLSPSLTSLNLAGCALKSIPMLNLPELTSLNLSGNLIAAPNSISLTNISQLEDLDVSGNRLNVVPNNLWSQMMGLRRLDVSGNPIHVIHEESFLGLDHLESLVLVDLSRLTTIASKALYPLFNLKSLTISTYSWIRKFSISSLVEDVHSLKELVIVMDDREVEGQSFPSHLLIQSNLPPKLDRVAIRGQRENRRTGRGITRLPANTFSRVQSSGLRLSISGTNISSLDEELFSSTPATIVSLDVTGNALSSVPDIVSSKARGRGRDQASILLT